MVGWPPWVIPTPECQAWQSARTPESMILALTGSSTHPPQFQPRKKEQSWSPELAADWWVEGVTLRLANE